MTETADNDRDLHEQGWRPWQRIVLGLVAFLVLAVAFTGPYLGLLQAHKDGQLLQRSQQQQAGIQQLLQFVAEHGPNAADSVATTRWYVTEFRNICAAEPGCVQAPLPPVLQQVLAGQSTPPPTPSTVPHS